MTEYTLMSTKVKLKFLVVTTGQVWKEGEEGEAWLYETYVWSWNAKEDKKDKVVSQEQSGKTIQEALDKHYSTIKGLLIR